MRLLLLLIGAAASGQGADSPPTCVTIRNEVVVDRPVDAVWARVGGWCTIAHWLNVRCETVSGNGDIGSVRRLNGVTLETMVARTEHSYAYWQTAGNMAAYSYHGSLAAEPIDGRRTRLIYTLLYDPSAMPSDAIRASERARLNTRFVEPLNAMKKMAEAK